jgi:hypothetical protein
MEVQKIGRSLLAVALAAGLFAGSLASAEDAGNGMTTVIPGDKKWEKAGKTMPYGMRVMYIYGDPTKPGPYIFRIRVPTAYRLPPHKFPDDRVVTILKGIWWTGVGDRYDPFKMDEYNAGTFYVTKAGTPHFDFARTEVILQIMGFGPVENPIEYLNPDDDPRGN